MPPLSNLLHLVEDSARRSPHADAILAPGARPLSFSALAENVGAAGAALRERGVRRNDAVAVVLPNGPAMAVTFLGVASHATAAPLNPTYREAELEFYLTDLGARALITSDEVDTPARRVAHKRGIPVLDLVSYGDAGPFQLAGPGSRPSPQDVPHPDDIALVLHTSGTTSAPKQVPLTQRNLVASARHIQEWLRLSHADRCLNVMPLFHIHGIMAALTASVAAGASVVCTPGFLAPRFFEWLEAFQPTWYTAVPTMHQSILERAPAYADVIERSPLRFIRSSSASLAPSVLAELEATFDAPVVEAYGMTEAAHQMTSNPLPPSTRKPGSVGVAAGPDVAVMDAQGALLPPGSTGEVVIRGPNVTAGYVANPEANAAAFTDGWFRTGDEGQIDGDGYLVLSGRIKEIINRAGEKIAPREIDEVLLDHPSVVQAVAFAVPHPRLGEEVGAVVVRAEGADVTERQLQEFVGARLAPFKVPRVVVFADSVPKGPTGKLQRIGLAERLGVSFDAAEPSPVEPEERPRTAVEEVVAGLWEEVLGTGSVGVHDRFIDVGGDSILATRLIARVRQVLDIELSIVDFFEAATVADQARLVEDVLLQDD